MRPTRLSPSRRPLERDAIGWVASFATPSPACGERDGVRGLGDWPRTLTPPLILTFSPQATARREGMSPPFVFLTRAIRRRSPFPPLRLPNRDFSIDCGPFGSVRAPMARPLGPRSRVASQEIAGRHNLEIAASPRIAVRLPLAMANAPRAAPAPKSRLFRALRRLSVPCFRLRLPRPGPASSL